jgi:hypothetical protein
MEIDKDMVADTRKLHEIIARHFMFVNRATLVSHLYPRCQGLPSPSYPIYSMPMRDQERERESALYNVINR